MKLRIRKGLFSWYLVDEKGLAVAGITNQKLFGAEKKISDGKGNIIFTTDIVKLPAQKAVWRYADSRKYVIYKDAKPVATATLSFAKKPERTKTQVFMLRLPRVEKMEVETPYGVWVIQRQKNNSLTIVHDGEPLGSVTPFFTFKPIYLECTEKYEITFWAGIYMLIEYMMHEDDLIVV